ncbi:MAG: glycosyltransferase family 39 protein [Anaerolineales bacterium]|nr:glycosyltransferase family 39 protein [Anaerolineales bacterium]
MQLAIISWIRSQYKLVLLFLSFLVILFGVIRLVTKPIEFTSGQTITWWHIIENVQSGKGYKYCENRYVPNCILTNQETAIREPFPIYFYASIGRLTGNSVVALQLTQVSIVLLVLFGIYLLGYEIGGLFVGLLGAWLWTFYLPALRLESYITGDLPESLFVIFGLLKFVHVVKHNKLIDWLQFGVLFALAALSRTAALSLLFGLGIGYIIFLFKTNQSSRLLSIDLIQKISISVFAFALLMSPWVVRNYIAFGEPVFSTTLVGYNLYRHNAIIAKDVPPHYVDSEEAYRIIFELVMRRDELLTPINEAQVNRIFQEEAFKIIREHPLKYVKLVVYRFSHLWLNISVKELLLMDYVYMVQNIFLLIAFILGLRKNNWVVRIIGCSTIFYLFLYLLVDAQLRYIIPVMPGMIMIGSVGLLSILPAKIQQEFI